MRTAIFYSFFLLMMVFAPREIFGQPTGGGPGGGGPPVPITGVEWLLGAGALFGLKSIINRVRSKKE